MYDVPYIQSKYFDPEVVATLARLAGEIRRIVPTSLPLGIQVSYLFLESVDKLPTR